MPRILVLCPYPEGVAAGQRLKYEQYLDDWRAVGFEVDVSPFMDPAMWAIVHRPGRTIAKALGTLRGHWRRLHDLARLGAYDIVYVHMWVTPFGTTVAERIVRARAGRLIYDIEDNLLAEGMRPTLRQLIKNVGKTRFLLRRADQVITASPFMLERYRAINQAGAATLIYPSVDTDRFRPAPGDARADERPVIGWTGTFSSRPYLDLLRPVFQTLAKRVDYRLIVIGNFPYELPGVDLEVLTWSAEEEVAQMQRLDIGVYPLPNDDWVLGKAGLKVIQYMAFGLPSVSSAVGTATRQVTEGVDGFLVDTPDQWVEMLERLCRDPGLRRRIGEAARREAVARYSREATKARYRAVLASIAGNASPG